MSKKSIFIYISILTAILIVIFGGLYFISTLEDNKEVNVSPEDITQELSLADSKVHFVAVGDNLIHNNIYEQAANRSSNGGYDFDFPYENIKDIIKNADLSYINQETILSSLHKPSSYPTFNTPTQMGDKLVSMGFDVINHSNNHVLDKGTKGAFSCIDFWESKPVLLTGLYKNSSDLENIKTIEKNGITFSFIGITEHTNGIPLPKNTDLTIVYTEEETTIEYLIKKADKISDVVVVCPHWGTENSNIISSKQSSLAEKMTLWGADIILGTHPHVLQGIETVTAENGNRSLCYYSLGNFISAQSKGNNLIGGIADFIIVKNNNTGEIKIENPKLIPIITHYTGSYNNIKIYPYFKYNDKLALNHGVKRKTADFSMKFIDSIINKYIGQEYLKLTPTAE
ncbi:MAG: CapA family protein [Clostridia bacterium]|nr:CapA family protein [Clostridia bacterium]